MTGFPIDAVRAQFPALAREVDGRPAVFFDAPGGTQACARAIDMMAGHLRGGTANAGGAFATSIETDALSDAAHAAVAELIGARSAEIAFGPNMTTLTFAVAHALARDWSEGDELVVTRLDHDANVAPWLAVAADKRMTVRWLDFDPVEGRWSVEALADLLGPRTRLVAIGGASNALGTLNPVAEAVGAARARSDALVYVDAVQSVPHVATDVVALGADFLAFSPYKMFGPHQGVLWADTKVAERVSAYKVRPAGTVGARRFETGTPSFEAQAGILGMVDYLEWLGGATDPAANSRRVRLIAAMRAAADHERAIGERLIAGLATVQGLRLHGPATMDGRVPTFALTIDGRAPSAIARHLAAHGIFAWSGHFYAVEAVARLGLADAGGLLRVGLCHYNTADEVDRLIEALHELTG